MNTFKPLAGAGKLPVAQQELAPSWLAGTIEDYFFELIFLIKIKMYANHSF